LRPRLSGIRDGAEPRGMPIDAPASKVPMSHRWSWQHEEKPHAVRLFHAGYGQKS
jgi:hypothetical protein